MKNTATQDLVRQMFHEVGGTFNVINALNNPVTQFTPEMLGKILRLVHDAGADSVKMEADLKAYLLSLGLKDPKGKLFPGKDFAAGTFGDQRSGVSGEVLSNDGGMGHVGLCASRCTAHRARIPCFLGRGDRLRALDGLRDLSNGSN